jgi:hypothetical protein
MTQIKTKEVTINGNMLTPAFAEGWEDAKRGVFNPDRIAAYEQWRYERGWAFRRYVERKGIKGIARITASRPGKVAPRIKLAYQHALVSGDVI